MAFGDHFIKRIKNKWNGEDVPNVSASDLYSGPAATWGYDPNAVHYTTSASHGNTSGGSTGSTTGGTSTPSFTGQTFFSYGTQNGGGSFTGAAPEGVQQQSFAAATDPNAGPRGPGSDADVAAQRALRQANMAALPGGQRGGSARDFTAPSWWQGTSGVYTQTVSGQRDPAHNGTFMFGPNGPVRDEQGNWVTADQYGAVTRDYQNAIDQNNAYQDPHYNRNTNTWDEGYGPGAAAAGAAGQSGGTDATGKSVGGSGGSGGAGDFGGVAPVAMGNVRGDDAGWAAAQLALQQMQERSQEGWSSLDRLALDQANRQASQYEQGQRQASQAGMAARGMGGSGMDALYAMLAQQGGADRSADNATTLGIAGRDRAMANTAGMSNLGLGMDAQAFNQAAQRAQAVDAFNQWSTGKQDDAAAQAYAAAMQRYQQIQQNRQNMVNGAAQGVAAMYGM